MLSSYNGVSVSGAADREEGNVKDRLKEQALFEQSPVLQAIIRLACPTVIGQIILVVYNMADTFFIGLTGSDAMVTAITICMPAFMFLSAISNLFGIGGASVISRALGVRRVDRARHTAAFAFWGCLAVSALYVLGVSRLMDGFIDLLGGADAQVHAQARKYLTVTVVFGGCFAAMSTLLSHLVRSEGRSVHAGVGIALGGILNTLLDPLFMFRLLPKGQEVLGAALATALSNMISALYFACIIGRSRGKSVLDFHFSGAMLSNGIPSAVLGCGLPACLMTLCENVSYAMLDYLMAANGIAMQAGIGVAKKINMLAHCMVRGMSQGVLPLISYSYGAGNYRRMKDTVAISMRICLVLSLACMAASMAFGTQMVGAFMPGGTDSVAYGADFLRILCIGAPFSACAYVVISFFQAVGCGMKSFVLAIMRKGILDIPMMLLFHTAYPVYGIVWATPIADMLCCVAAVRLFSRFIRGYDLCAGQPVYAMKEAV